VVKDNLSKIACISSRVHINKIFTFEWHPFDHVAIDHKSLTVREQWEIYITVGKFYNNYSEKII